MGLRCLLGHDFGPPGVVREHEEDGNEMVITEREIQRCTRCGEEQVIAESTEVRAIMSEGDVGRADDAESDRLLSPEETSGIDPEQTSGLADADSEPEALRDAADGVTAPADATATAQADGAAEESNTSLLERAEQGFDEPPDAPAPDEEDAVILDESDEKPPRKHGEWPDSSDVGRPDDRDDPGSDETTGDVTVDAADTTDDDSASVVDADDADGADDADSEPDSLAETAAEEDAELLGDSGGDHERGSGDGDGSVNGRATADTEAAADDGRETSAQPTNGSWPEHEEGEADQGFSAGTATPGGPSMAYGSELTPSTNGEGSDDDYDTSYLDNAVEERDGDGTIVSAGADTDTTPPAGVETEYYCPNCDHTRALDSSIRSGDICPSCQAGYIAERAR